MRETAERFAALRLARLCVGLLLLSASFILARTGRDAMYLERGGLYDLPAAYMAIAVLSVPTAFGTLSALRRFGTHRTRIVLPVLVAAVLGLAWLGLPPGGGVLGTAFFVFVPLAFGVVFSVSWLLAGEILEDAAPAARARAYARVGAAAILGGVLGGVLARVLAPVVDPRELLLAAAALAVGGAVFLAAGQWSVEDGAPAGAAVPEVHVRDLVRQRYPALLLLVSMSAALVGVLVEFQLYVTAAASGRTGREGAAFFATVYVVLNAGAFVVQLWLAPALQRRIGVQGCLQVLPAALLGGTVLLVATASGLVRSVLRVAEGGLKASIHRVNWEQAYLPLPRDQRPAAKVLVDGAAARVAEGLGAALLFVWLRFVVRGTDVAAHDASWLAWLLLAATTSWVALTRALGRRLGPAAGGEDRLRFEVPLPET